MGLFDDIGDLFGNIKETVQQGTELYQQFAGTGTNPTAPTVLVTAPVPVASRIPTWAIVLVGVVVIYALAKGVRRG